MKLILLMLAVALLLVQVTQGKQDLSQGAVGHVQGILGGPNSLGEEDGRLPVGLRMISVAKGKFELSDTN